MMKRLQRRSWPLLIGAFGGYIVWDIVDHTLLEAGGLWGTYAVDWCVIGVVGATTWWLVDQYQRRKPAAPPAPDAPVINVSPAVMNQTVSAVKDLDATVQDINARISDAFSSNGLDQQKSLRQALIAAHEAQMLIDELVGLVNLPRPQSTPTQQELYEHKRSATSWRHLSP